jgi:hypothetical protein
MDIKNSFSAHLFWDVDLSAINPEQHAKYIISSVLKYGLFEDWIIIKKYYGLNKIIKAAVNIRDLDKKTATFLSLIADVPKEKFLCYSTKQSTPKHWNF